ncbi:MAG: translocation/assembly module TamB domain-containing protein [Saprospiraceae bacterium]|nr:translocation/assembly module TamB domain-containing protein [Saprospiraceae bacterium]
MNKQSEKEEVKEQKPRVQRTWWQRLPRFLIRVFFGFVALFMLVFILFQIPAFQNFVANKIMTTLSSAWGTKVELKSVQLEFFDQLVLEDFYVEDLHQDTLIYAEQLKVNLNTGLVSLFKRRLEIEEISLRHARIYMHRQAGSEEQNIQFLIEALSKKEPEPSVPVAPNKKKPFQLGLESLYLEDVVFSKQDSLYGSDQQYRIARGAFLFDEFDLAGKIIRLSSAKLEDPEISLHLFPQDQVTVDAIWNRDSVARVNKWPPDIPDFNHYFVFPWDFLSYSDFSFLAWQLEWPPMDSIFAQEVQGSSMLFSLESLDVMGGRFHLLNTRWGDDRLIPDNVLDFRDLHLSDVYANIRDFEWKDKKYTGDIRRIALNSDAGFVVKKIASSSVYVDSKGVRLENLEIETPYSNIGNQVILNYDEFSDFKQFVYEVELDSVNIRDASIAVRDIMAFAPALEQNIYFQNNRDKTLLVNADLFGTIDNLSGNNLEVILDRSTFLSGSFGFFNLTVPENQYLNLSLERLVTNMGTLRQLIPNFNPPTNFDKLGKMDFEGRFDGFFYDFVANGNLRSDLGQAILDMKLSTIGGRENALYSGRIKLIGFDLGTWSESPYFGKITMSSEVQNGKGLTASSAEATLSATIDSFYVRGYNYQNLEMNGQLQENLFDGEVTITDNNIDMDFAGTIDFTDRVPLLAFNSDIRTLDLKKLNLIKADYSLEGKVNINVQDIDISKMQGRVRLSELVINHGRDQHFLIDTVSIESSITSPEYRELTINSDIFSAHLKGDFDVAQIPDQLLQFSEKHFPRFSDKLHIPVSDKQVDSTSNFEYAIEVFDTKGLLELVNPKLEEISDLYVFGSFDIPAESFKFDMEAAEVQYGNLVFDDVVVVVKAREGGSDLNVAIGETHIGENLTLAPINMLGLVDQDTLFFGITAYDFSEILNTIEVDGQFFPVEEDFIVRFEQSDIILWNQLWQIDANNFLRVGDDYVRTRDFVLRNGDRRIVLESLGRRGLLFQLQNYDLESVNDLWVYDKLKFDGRVQVQASVKDIFKFEGLQASIVADTLLINQDDFGSLLVKLKAESLKSRIEATFEGGRSTQQIDIAGYYNPVKYVDATDSDPANYLNFKAKLADLPLSILEYWIGAGVRNTVGTIQASIDLEGPPQKPEIKGEALVQDAGITIDYLNTRYYIDDQKLILSSTMMDATNAIVTDEEGNKATLTGGILHNHLKDFRLGVTLLTDRFLGLNTVKGQNSLFYGTAYANGRVTFSGPFNRTDVYVNASTSGGTMITLPVDYGRDASEVSFIKFRDKRQQQEIDNQPETLEEALGLSIILDLDVRENAQVSIVFNEQLGDVLRSKGRGNLRMVVTREGDFQLIGNYEVVQGDYLFTLMNVGLNKPFIVEEGSTLRWDGDPFGADIDLVAKYENFETKVTNFIGEYLLTASQTAKDQADTPTKVDLTMRLTGELLNPDIEFNIDFPTLSGELKSYTDSKLRLIRQDQNEMNRQVFGLIVVGQFLPSDFSLTGNEFNIGFNTVTEMIFQQFSNYLTGLVSEWLREDGLISGIDFKVDYRTLQEAEAIAENPILYYQSGELEVRLSNYLLDDRLSVNVGGNFDLGGSDFVEPGATQGAYFAGDLVIEYALTEDRDLKIRFYQSTEPELNGDRLNKTGIGLSYRKQFDSFSGFLNGLKGATKRLPKKD